MAWNNRIPTAESLARITNWATRKAIGKSDGKKLRKALEDAAAKGSKAKALLGIVNTLLDAHGVESLYPDYPEIYYVNLGDTYDTTLLLNVATGNLYVGAWGDYVERHS